MSASEERLLQHMGWGLGRRGLANDQAATDLLTLTPNQLALKGFWKHLSHFSILAWALGVPARQLASKKSTVKQPEHEVSSDVVLATNLAAATSLLPTGEVASQVPNSISFCISLSATGCTCESVGVIRCQQRTL